MHSHRQPFRTRFQPGHRWFRRAALAWRGSARRSIIAWLPRWCLVVLSTLALTGVLTGCGPEQGADETPVELLFYCGITMAHPMGEIARNFEQHHGVKVTISQGGSEDLYQSLAASRKGDLYRRSNGLDSP